MTVKGLPYGVLCAVACLSHGALAQPARDMGEMAGGGAAEPLYAADYMRRAASFLKQGQWQQALDDFARVLKIDAGFRPALVGQAWAYLNMRDFAAARKSADRALAIKPDDAEALKVSAAIRGRMGDMAAAMSQLDKAITARPEDANSLNMRGGAKYLAGDEEGALSDLDQATRAAPKMVAPYAERAQILLRRGDPARAAAEGDALLAAAPDDPAAFGYAAGIFANTGRMEDAARAFDRLVAMKPDDPNVWIARSRFWPDDQRDKAIADAEKALVLKPDMPNALLRLAELRKTAGDYPGALQLYERLEAQNHAGTPGLDVGALSYIRSLIAEIYARTGREEDAARLFAEVRATAGKNASALNSICYQAAAANFALEQALADCRASLALKVSPGVQDSLGFVLLRMGRLDAAIAAYDAGLAPERLQGRSLSTEAHLLYGRGLARIAKGQMAEGEADLDRARTLSRTVEADFRHYGMLPRS